MPKIQTNPPTRNLPRLLVLTDHEIRVLGALAGLADFDPVPAVTRRLAHRVRRLVRRASAIQAAA